MNVLYLKEFYRPDKLNSYYIGITSNFKKRMNRHKISANSGSMNLVHRAMRKYKHNTEILMEFDEYGDMLKYEVLVIKNYRELGYDIYNRLTV